ncbi:MAG: ATP-binding protein, partial [Chloroflexi bacterium]|nr:ATP-binding protein [Chloroflexota bacterium]
MFTLDDDIMRQLRATFKVEAAEHIQAINRILLALEKNPEGDERKSLLEEIFREAHSLKGASGAADLREVEGTAHKLESVFGAAKSGKIQITRELADVLYAGVDAVALIIDAALEEKSHGIDLVQLHARLEAAEKGVVLPGPAPAPAAQSASPESNATPEAQDANPVPAPAPVRAVEVVETRPAALPQPAAPTVGEQPAEAKAAAAPAPEAAKPVAAEHSPKTKTDTRAAVEETIRVSTEKIDSLMTQAGELLVAGLKIDQRLHEVEQVSGSLEEWTREWLEARAGHSDLFHDGEHEALRPLIKLLDMNQERMRALSVRVSDLKRGFTGDALHLARITNDLGESVMKVRMLPVSTVFDAFPRMVRDLARDHGKEIEVVMEGTETELDRKMLEEIKDPLLHMLRNAVDHGIESPDVREKADKPRQGTIVLKAFQKGNNIVIEIADDGGGINRDKVRKSAVKAGILSPDEAQAMGDDEALRLIFASGLSTSLMITDISGRGVGMDVVRKNVEALQGQVDVESKLGVGTTISLTLPLTLATTQELLVQVGDETYGIPISAVERIQHIQTKDIGAVQGRKAVLVNDEPVSLVRLADVLERPTAAQAAESNAKVPTVILGTGKRRIAFLVDGGVGQQETVVNDLGESVMKVRMLPVSTVFDAFPRMVRDLA